MVCDNLAMTPDPKKPLDAGSINGPEIWRTVEGVAFCHWDRWLMRLVLDQPAGLERLERRLFKNIVDGLASHRNDMALRAQILDLQARLRTIGLGPSEVLDETERASLWLLNKAEKRILHGRVNRGTAAMRNTPDVVFEARVLWGNLALYPTSPKPYARHCCELVGEGWYDESVSSDIVGALDADAERALLVASDDLGRLAVHRGLMTALCVGMEHLRDSYGEGAELYRVHEVDWLACVARAERPALLRDVVEMLVWNAYGLVQASEAFLGDLPEPGRQRALSELARLVAELDEGGLVDNAREARNIMCGVALSGG